MTLEEERAAIGAWLDAGMFACLSKSAEASWEWDGDTLAVTVDGAELLTPRDRLLAEGVIS